MRRAPGAPFALPLFALAGVALLAAPIAIVATILAVPLWRRLEVSTGIESIGHSGPASWCYVSVYALLCLTAAVAWMLLRRRSA